MAQRFEGKNLEEALTQAAEKFGVERYQLTYHVVLEKRGFLGGMKHVVVEAEVNEGQSAPAAPAQAPRHEGSRPSGAGRGPSRNAGAPQADRGRGRGRGNREQGEGRGGRRRRREGNRDEAPRDQRDFDVPVASAPEQGAESEHALLVRSWCEELLALAKLSAELRTEENDTQIIVRVYGRDAGRLTERNGELLDAIQVLANKALNGRKVEKDIELDCAQFKEKRVEDLGVRARETADEVRRNGREQVLPAMTPIERRIVHLALAEDADVMTESRGEGFFKRVAIVPRPAGQQTES